MSIFNHYQDRYKTTQEEVMTLQEYLQLCKEDPGVYASAPERMLMAIGEPELVDTSNDSRLSRICSISISSIKRHGASMIAVFSHLKVLRLYWGVNCQKVLNIAMKYVLHSKDTALTNALPRWGGRVGSDISS